jgi:polysaccharide pyruvyl transferase WcaK-like protein
MRILILWADERSPNLGVRALGSGTASLVQRVWPEAEITFQNYGHRAREVPFGRIRSLLKERASGTLGMQRWLGGYDLVVDTRSGDSFTDGYGLHRLAIMTAVAEFASQADVPVVLGPQTIGPFATRRGRMLARRSLHRSVLTMARDEESARRSAQLGYPADVLTTDVVFALPAVAVDRTRDVILGVSGLLWNRNPHVDSARYRDVVSRLHRRLTDSGRQVSLLAHVLDSPASDNDVPAIREFEKTAARGAELLVPTGLQEVRAILASANAVVASRMHACLNALSVGTPAIPLAYSRKFEPLLRGIGWNHTVDLEEAGTVESAMRQLDQDLRPEVAAAIESAHDSLARAEYALRETGGLP